MWDLLGAIHNFFDKNDGSQSPYDPNKKINFGTSLDIAKSLPKNPRSYNDYIETGRQGALNAVGSVLGKPSGIVAGGAAGAVLGPGGAAVGAGFGAAAFTIAELDKKTNGKATKALMAGTGNVRSNYAFLNDITRHDAGMGLLAGLGMLAGGALGAVAGFGAGLLAGGVGAVPGAVAGFGIGAGLAGKAERALSEAGAFDAIDKDIKKSAKLSQSAVGQEKYNFGRDVVHNASNISGWKTLGDTQKGIGALTSGILNFGFEIATAPDIKGVKLAGVVTKGAVVGGINAKLSGPIEKSVARLTNEPARAAQRLANDIELHKKTAAGETTVYTDLYEFIKNSDAVSIQSHSQFKNNEYGQVAASLLAGKDAVSQSLIFRIGRGDKTALAELQTRAPATFAEIQRLEAQVKFTEKNGLQTAIIGENDSVLNSKIIKEELSDLRSTKSWLDRSLFLDSALQERTVASGLPKSFVKHIELVKLDRAQNRVAMGLEQGALDTTTRATLQGKATQTIYQKTGLSVVVRTINRALDDAPHQTVNFNDAIQSATRIRTTARMAVARGVMTPLEARKFANDFAMAEGEGVKNLLVEAFNEKIITRVAEKHSLPETLRNEIVARWLNESKMNVAKAKEAKNENRAYFVEGEGLEQTIVKDPLLISQLANGAYLADVKLLDKAFGSYKKRRGEASGLPLATAHVRSTLDEFQSVWRTFTLARVGFPINIIRDSTLRSWGDGVLFDSIKNLGTQTLRDISNSHNTVARILKISESRINPAKNIKRINQDITMRTSILEAAEKELKDSGYVSATTGGYKVGDVYTSKKSNTTGTILEMIPNKNGKSTKIKLDVNGKVEYRTITEKPGVSSQITPEIQKQLDYIKIIKQEQDAFRKVRDSALAGIPSKTVGRKTQTVAGVEGFETAFSGVQGQIMLEKIRGRDTMRGLIGSTRELGIANVRRDRDGGVALVALEDENLHMSSWVNTLTNHLAVDEVAKKIMAQKLTEKEIIAWIASHESGNYLERFGIVKSLGRKLSPSDAQYVYNRVLSVVDKLAPEPRLQTLILKGEVTPKILKEMYPDLAKRPTVISDLNRDLLGQSNFVVKANASLKDAVAWLATVPTAKLSYNPYFEAKYQEKLQNMVALANSQGRRLAEKDKAQFESVARAHALTEFRNKINSFSRDMNYPAAFNYLVAFFPAIVEQYRAYGKIMLDHPEFPYKISQMAQIPDYIGDVKVDAYGDTYVEVDLPALGIKGRLPTTWFNAINPTGGQVLSPGPLSAVALNEISKKYSFGEGEFAQLLLPFGTSANALAPLTPNTLRRGAQAYQAFVGEDGEQFNKDVNMFIEKLRFEYVAEYHIQPPNLGPLYREAKDKAKSLALLRALGSGILPLQPKFVSPLQVYSDLLVKYNDAYGSEGNDRFADDYPDYFLLVDKLTDSLSGVRSDDTAVALVKKNGKVIENIISSIGEKGNLSTLGAIFNDDDYAFSSSAQAYLVSHAIPGTKQKFKEQGAALENNRSSIVNLGWKNYTKMIEIVTQELTNNDYDPSRGFGLATLDAYKKAYVDKMQTDNNLWYEEKQGAGFQKRQVDTINALTTAVNSPSLWQDLAKQERWYTIVEYLNFRYDVYDMLKYRQTSINTDKAIDIKNAVGEKVADLRKKDVNFGAFYDRYFTDDDFTYIVETTGTGGKR